MDRAHGDRGQGGGHRLREGVVPVGGVRARARPRPRGGPDEDPRRPGHPPGARRGDGGARGGRPGRRGRARHGDRRGRRGHRAHDPPHPTLSETVAFAAEAVEGTIDGPVRAEARRRPVADERRTRILQPSASYSITMRVRLPQRPGSFALVASAIGAPGRDPRRDRPRARRGRRTSSATSPCHAWTRRTARRSWPRSRQIDGVSVQAVSDRTFQLHLRGKIGVHGTVPLKTRDDLSMAYTPGVARVSQAIHEDTERAWNLTVKGNTVAVVTDGTAVLGLGDIGPEAAMPVMEGKALLFKEFAGVDAYPLCLATKDVDEIVAVVKAVVADVRRDQPGGHLRAALLRDRAPAARGARHPGLPRRPARHRDRAAGCAAERAPRGGQARRGRPRRHDRRRRGGHGVHRHPARAGRRRDRRVRPVTARSTASGSTSIRPAWRWPSARTRAIAAGRADELLEGADVFIGVSVPGAVSPEAIRTMADRSIVFAMANPTPEVRPEEVRADVADHGDRAVRLSRTRSTTCSRSPACSAARWTLARRRSTRA